jgi:hypothetical protein
MDCKTKAEAVPPRGHPPPSRARAEGEEVSDETPEEYGRRRAEAAAAKIDPTSVAQVASLRIALCELAALLIEKKVLTKRDVVSHFQGVADQIMPVPNSGDIGTKVFEEIAGYVLAIKDD